MYYISIEGSIAAGKTTLLHSLAAQLMEKYNIILLEEPTSIWENVFDTNGMSALEQFYSGAVQPFWFEMFALATRASKLNSMMNNNMTKNTIILSDRSPLCAVETFAAMSRDSGKMSNSEFDELQRIAKTWQQPNMIIYLPTSIEECTRRQGIRDYVAIDAQYQSNLHKYIETFVMKQSNVVVYDDDASIINNLIKQMEQVL